MKEAVNKLFEEYRVLLVIGCLSHCCLFGRGLVAFIETISAFMDINYLGHSSFRLKGRTGTLVTDPFDSHEVGFKFPSTSADLVTISHNHGDHNKAELVDGSPYIINGPGEYEVSGISVVGYPTYHDDKKGEEKGQNTVYVFEIDDLRLAHLGDLGHKLSEKLVEELGDIDILFIPVGGFYTIDSTTAVSIVGDIEPSIIIPMHYKQPGINESVFGKLTTVDDFVKSLGVPSENLPKLSIKKSEMAEEQKVVVLEIK